MCVCGGGGVLVGGGERRIEVIVEMQKKGGCPSKNAVMHASRLIDNVEMYKYTKFYQNIPCGSRVKSVFANGLQTTHTPIIVHTSSGCAIVVLGCF